MRQRGGVPAGGTGPPGVSGGSIAPAIGTYWLCMVSSTPKYAFVKVRIGFDGQTRFLGAKKRNFTALGPPWARPASWFVKSRLRYIASCSMYGRMNTAQEKLVSLPVLIASVAPALSPACVRSYQRSSPRAAGGNAPLAS